MCRSWVLIFGLVGILAGAGVVQGQSYPLTQDDPDANASFFSYSYTYNSGSNVGKLTITSTSFNQFTQSPTSGSVGVSSSTFDLTAYLEIISGKPVAIPAASLPGGDVDSLVVKGTPTGGGATDYYDSTELDSFGFGSGDTNNGVDMEFLFRQDGSGTETWPNWPIGVIVFGGTTQTPSGSAPNFAANFNDKSVSNDVANIFNVPEPSSAVLMLGSFVLFARRSRRRS